MLKSFKSIQLPLTLEYKENIANTKLSGPKLSKIHTSASLAPRSKRVNVGNVGGHHNDIVN